MRSSPHVETVEEAREYILLEREQLGRSLVSKLLYNEATTSSYSLIVSLILYLNIHEPQAKRLSAKSVLSLCGFQTRTWQENGNNGRKHIYPVQSLFASPICGKYRKPASTILDYNLIDTEYSFRENDRTQAETVKNKDRWKFDHTVTSFFHNVIQKKHSHDCP